MNREGQALLRAILDDPDDDVSRLVYADWLAENGDEARGQLIRVQVEAARLAPSRLPADRQRFAECTAQASSLLVQNQSRWLAELPQVKGQHWLVPAVSKTGPIFQRGFVNYVACNSWELFQEYGPALFAQTPIERLSIRLEKVTQLRALAQTPWLRNLRWLELLQTPIGMQGMRLLSDSPFLTRLQRLDVERPLGEVAFPHVFQTPFFLQLDTLCLNQVAPAAHGLASISDAPPQWPMQMRLRRLEWSCPYDLLMYLQAMRIFSASPLILPPRLTWLRLQSQQGQGDALVNEIVQMPQTQQLRRLVLRNNRITDRGALRLAQSDLLDDLELLDLRNNPIGPSVARRLRQRFDHGEGRILLGTEGQP
ncbi:MAG: TIGR02996 domain-containing protein [Gemmataceae bacterium]